MTLSPLAPDSFPDLPPIAGIKLGTAASGMRYQGRDDLLLISLAPESSVAGVFTQSDTAAAPVGWSRKIAKTGTAAAIITNAGNANAFTGSRGDDAVHEMVNHLASHLDCDAGAIMVASTGVIGEPLDAAKLVPYFEALVTQSNASWQDAANAILTTDTFAKGAHATCMIDGVSVDICGIAKGSGMIAPNMATMLGYIGTDAAVPADVLADCLRAANDDSFNAITVDSDTSTNDSVFLMASGMAGNRLIADVNDPALADFRAALAAVMRDLAIQIVAMAKAQPSLSPLILRVPRAMKLPVKSALPLPIRLWSKPLSLAKMPIGAGLSWRLANWALASRLMQSALILAALRWRVTACVLPIMTKPRLPSI